MITEHHLANIRLLSDNELYDEAVNLISRIGGTIPSAQMNGLLNVTLARPFSKLEEFVKHQRERKTWPYKARYVPRFYSELSRKLENIEHYIPSITEQQDVSQEDKQTLKMLLAREFIQHLLAENDYKSAR